MNSLKSLFSSPHTGQQRAPVTPARRRRLLLSYLPDWIITIALAVALFSLDKVDGYRRDFSLQDTSLRHPHAVHERVPNFALYLICFLAPFVIQPVINLLTIRSWWDFHNGSLGLILGLAITGSFTQFTKITVGRPRPDVINRCQPPAGSMDPPFGLTNSSICTQMNNRIMRDGFRSFPSGHASMSFAGLGFLALYLAGKLHLFDRRGHAAKAWLSLAPYAVAALVAISRTMDYRHHWHDVVVGALLGTVISYFTYRQYYPPLTSELSHRPYSPRIQREDKDAEVLPIHNRRQSTGNDDPSQSLPPRPSHDSHAGTHEPFTNNKDDLDGTVMRPNPGVLQDIWRDGDREHSNERNV